jgi:hypothetical protein
MALGPINYQMQVATPFESVLQGMTAGAKLADIEAARAAQAAKIEAQRQAMALAEQRQRAVADLFATQNPSYEQTANVLAMLPAEQGKLIADLRTRMSDDQRKNYGAFTAKVVTGLLSERPEVATRMIEEHAAGERDPERRKQWETIKGIAQISPKDAAAMARAMGAGLFGKDWFESLGAATKPPAQVLSTPEQKRNAGLLDDKGNVLAGTFVIEEGKGPTQLRVDTVPADAVIVSSDEEKRRRGLVDARGAPIPGVFAVEPGKAPKRVDETQRPLVEVKVPGAAQPPTEFEKAIDRKAADVYTAWTLEGGSSNAVARIAQLKTIVKQLERNPNLTGPQIQVLPEWSRALLVPASQAARQNAERIVQEGLRPILGAQFTQTEGENFLKRMFDPALGAKENSRRLQLLVQQMESSYKQTQSAVNFIEKNRTLQGFKGVVPSIADFEAAITGRRPASTPGGTPPQGVEQALWDAMTPEERSLWQK